MYDNRKKSPKANLDKQKGTYWLLGIVAALLIVYLGFEFVTSSSSTEKTGMVDDDAIMIIDEKTMPTDDRKKEKFIPTIRPDIIIQITQKPITDTFDWGRWFNGPEVIPEPEPIPLIPETTGPEPAKRWVEEMPKFPGEADAWQKYLQKNLKYPKMCVDLGITGTVLVEFVIEKDGSTSGIKVLVSAYPDLDAEAVKVIKNSPKWIPGKQMGKPVRVFYQIPIKFTLH